MKTLELYGVGRDQLLVKCCRIPPEGDLATMQTAAASDAEELFLALDAILPFGTWSQFLHLCKHEAAKL